MSLGWYVHHHGRGHLQRFLTVAPELDDDITVLSSLMRPSHVRADRWIELPPDVPVDPERRDSVQADGLLHWAPLGSGGFRQRMAAISAWIEAADPAAMVVDVSVEVALLARLMGSDVIWVTGRGLREDEPHRLAYRAASARIAPWTPATETQALGRPGGADPDLSEPDPKLHHVGAFSRFDDRPVPAPVAERRVCVLLGFGGHEITTEQVEAAARATPEWTWEIAGLNGLTSGANLISHGPDCDVWALLSRAAVVVASASTNAVAEVAAARRPLICLPQDRPFGEQHDQAKALCGAGLAITRNGWPAEGEWSELLDDARGQDPDRWQLLHDGRGARRFADVVRATACA